MSERIALFGGSFDPPHIGHLYVAESVRHTLECDRVLFIPSFLPPHKAASLRVPVSERVELVRRAIAGNDAFVLESYEVDRGGVSYTIDTLKYVSDRYDLQGRPLLIIGDDLVPGFAEWRAVDELREISEIVVARRHNISSSVIERIVGPHREISNTVVDVSSSGIRERIASGQAFRYLVPDPVYFYIDERGLYR